MKEPIFTKNFFCIFMAQFCIAMVMYMLITTIAEYVSAFGVSASIAGLVSGIYVFGGLFSRLSSASLLAKYGWKRVAMAFLILHFAACLFYFVSTNIVLLLIVRFIHGLGFGAGANAIMVVGMASLPKSRYGEATGYFMLSTSLGIAVGPFLGGLIYDQFGGTGSFAAASILSFATVFFMMLVNTDGIEAARVSTPSRHRISVSESADSIVNDDPGTAADTAARKADPVKAGGINRFFEKESIPVSLCILFLSVGYASLLSFYRLYAADLDMTKEFSYFFLIYAIVILVSRPAAGIIQDRFGDAAVCCPCFLFQVAALILLAWRPCMATVVLGAAGSALGYGTMNSTLNVIANRNVSNERRSYAVATYWACCDLGVGVSPFFLGLIVSAAGYYAMYLAAAAVSFISLPVFLMMSRRQQKH